MAACSKSQRRAGLHTKLTDRKPSSPRPLHHLHGLEGSLILSCLTSSQTEYAGKMTGSRRDMFLNNNTSGLNDYPPHPHPPSLQLPLTPIGRGGRRGRRLLSEASPFLNCISESFLTDGNSESVIARRRKRPLASA